MSTVISFDSSLSLRYSRSNQLNHQDDIDYSTQTERVTREKIKEHWIEDNYHQQLKEEERKYLLAKFM